ncbi:MAG: hypothetical protein RL557_428 [archaeon]|jgi:small subunit ribosomal protein S4e
MHINRKNIGKFWPVPRTGTKYVAVSTHNQHTSIPLVVVMRDILKLIKNRKELKKLLSEKQVFINGENVRETHYPLSLFDVISLPTVKKHYRAVLSEHRKMKFEEISEKEAEKKVLKVIGKKMLKGKIIQINFLNGRNALLKDSISVDDSVLYNFKQKKIEKIIRMETGRKVYLIQGKHIGNQGTIESIIERGGKKLLKMKGNDDKINVWVKNVIVME